MNASSPSRRRLLHAAAGTGLMALGAAARAEPADFTPAERHPAATLHALDPAFAALFRPGATVERLATGFRWAEGPAWFDADAADGGHLLFSDVATNRMLRHDAATGRTTVFRAPSGNSNGLARDRDGRLLACEHLGGRVTRTERDGSVTVLADRFDGQPLNSPNDLVCARDGAVWFTDPPYGLVDARRAGLVRAEQPHGVYRLDVARGRLDRVIADLSFPNGLAFARDERRLYVVARKDAGCVLLAFEVDSEARVGSRSVLFETATGTLDGLRVDTGGNLWCAWGAGANPGHGLAPNGEGVIVLDARGRLLGQIALPERCANLCFGGVARDRLFMTATTSLYALDVAAQGLG